jgi:hypothetical protein
MTVPKKPSYYKPKRKAKVKLRKITPIPDKPNSYIVEHEVHEAPLPAPLDVPLPEEVLDLNSTVDQVPVQGKWAKWWKSLW